MKTSVDAAFVGADERGFHLDSNNPTAEFKMPAS